MAFLSGLLCCKTVIVNVPDGVFHFDYVDFPLLLLNKQYYSLKKRP